jgi:hypothetical protein
MTTAQPAHHHGFQSRPHPVIADYEDCQCGAGRR